MQRDRRPRRPSRAPSRTYLHWREMSDVVRIHKAENAVRLLARSLLRLGGRGRSRRDCAYRPRPSPSTRTGTRLASSLASPSHLSLPPPPRLSHPRFPFRILTLKIGPLGTGESEGGGESHTQHTRENRLTIVTVNQEEKARGGNAITCTSRRGESRPFVCS